ncbi:uncharacterized protein LOC115624601 isoform X2 [Scaptodrosophila lebanonensis]|uniref:Uncharacterized protein LOC115624601 isoform X2 n=1 Tax=Drosophila lebanonensis TaxID=7225 RepID=A0A6J2TJ99_DROLE|nr:uncharacterized protein LOC115624601 isoform X2 [Scaptodrosophila lebanonensis]
MISSLFSRLVILFFGTLYPAYASYKAVRTKNVKEYVKWMMYWIVFAFFTCIETFTDIFLSWFPFYYEVKVIIVLWLLSPATKGSSTLYRKFVHPMLTRREQEIDEYLNQARERGYSAVLQLGSKGVNYATNVIMQTAIKGGGNLVQTIKRSYSLSDLSEPDVHRTQDELDAVMSVASMSTRPQPRLLRPRQPTAVGRSASVSTRHSTGMYFTEIDVTSGKNSGDFNYNIRSTGDISSGYSSAEPINAGVGSGLSRTSSMTNASKARLKSKRNEADAQLLDDMRAEVYLENERYFQSTHKGPEYVKDQDVLETGKDDGIVVYLDTGIRDEAEEEDEDQEQEFYEALPIVDEPENKTEPIDCLTTINIMDKDSESCQEKLDDKAIDTTIAESSTLQESTGTKDRPVTPRELRATLEEIKHSFRAQLEPELSPSLKDSPELRPKAQHSKGRAPAPPLPPRPKARSPQPDTISLQSNKSTTSERASTPSKSGIGNLFKNIKANVLRNKINQHGNENEHDVAEGVAVNNRETEI